MELENYMQEAIGVETALYVPADDMIIRAEDYLKVRFGTQLKDYLRNYGYIRNETVRFYGLSRSKSDTSIVETTSWLHDRFILTRYFTCIQAKDKKNVILVDTRDNVYSYKIGSNVVVGKYMRLNDYILKELNAID